MAEEIISWGLSIDEKSGYITNETYDEQEIVVKFIDNLSRTTKERIMEMIHTEYVFGKNLELKGMRT